MSEEQKEIKKVIKDKDIETSSLNFLRCSIHDISYPQGSSCPKCKQK